MSDPDSGSDAPAPAPLTTDNLNHLWADLLVDELVRSGVGLFCLAPGSRSAPLMAAVARHPRARHLLHFDERATAFAALGYGRATGRPAAWITTSGTAVANGLPAVIEASVDHVPLLLLTADRPPELAHTGANQTIEQPGLFGGYTRWAFDLPAPTTEIPPAFVLTTADQAVARATGRPPGPVHLNCRFREPLAPRPHGDFGDYAAAFDGWRRRGVPYTRYAPSELVADGSDLAEAIGGVERGLVTLGRVGERADAEAAAALAAHLGWPLLPDVASGLRLEAGTAAPVVPYFDHLLAPGPWADAHAPDAVLHLGARMTSKRLAQFVERTRPGVYAVIRAAPDRLDPTHAVTHRLTGSVAATLRALQDGLPRQGQGLWTAAWAAASRTAEAAIERVLDADGSLSEPLVARALTHRLPAGHALMLGSSMPIRDADMYGTHRAGGPHLVCANRGASGIDGTLATGVGVQEGLGRPVTVLLGDLALLHDLNSLALIRERPVTVVVVNNHGGGIFHFLPIARHAEVFEPFFTTPHPYTFEEAAAMFGLAYARPTTPAAFAESMREAQERTGGTVIEVETDREANHALHRQLVEAVQEALRVTHAPR